MLSFGGLSHKKLDYLSKCMDYIAVSGKARTSKWCMYIKFVGEGHSSTYFDCLLSFFFPSHAPLGLDCFVFHQPPYQRQMSLPIILALIGCLKTKNLYRWRLSGLQMKSPPRPMARKRFLHSYLRHYWAVLLHTLPILREPLSLLHCG